MANAIDAGESMIISYENGQFKEIKSTKAKTRPVFTENDTIGVTLCCQECGSNEIKTYSANDWYCQQCKAYYKYDGCER